MATWSHPWHHCSGTCPWTGLSPHDLQVLVLCSDLCLPLILTAGVKLKKTLSPEHPPLPERPLQACLPPSLLSLAPGSAPPHPVPSFSELQECVIGPSNTPSMEVISVPPHDWRLRRVGQGEGADIHHHLVSFTLTLRVQHPNPSPQEVPRYDQASS